MRRNQLPSREHQHRLLAHSIAALLFAPTLFAVTETWDGGGIDSLFITGANWLDNTAPASDLVNTDLIFGAALRLNPTLPFEFSADSITFNNAAGAYGFSGARLNVGDSGIVNNDTQTMTFTNDVSFGGVASSEIRANTGGLTFSDNIVILPFTELTVSGSANTSFTRIANFVLGDTGRIEKTGPGTMTCSLPAAIELLIQAGTVSMAADGGTDVFSSTSTISVNGTSTFNINENLTLNGAQLTRATGGDINLAAGKTLTVQNGADVEITGTFSHSTDSNIVVSGAGSTFSTTSVLGVSGGGTFSVLLGGTVITGNTFSSIAQAAGSAVVVDGSGSSVSSAFLSAGGNGGSVTFRNDSDGSVGVMVVGEDAPGSSGTVNFQSGAIVSSTGLRIAAFEIASTGVVNVTGDDTELSHFGGSIATIGAASASSGTLNVQDDGTFNSTTGLTTVHATGTIAITGGIYNSNGSLTLNGGQLTRDANGTFALDAGRVLTVQAGGDAFFTGGYANTTDSVIVVTGAGSTLGTNGGLSIGGDCRLNVLAGGSVSAGGQINIATNFGPGVSDVDGAGSTLSTGTLFLGGGGFAGSLTFSNGSTGTFNFINVDPSAVAGTSGILIIQSGATVSGTGLSIAPNAVANTGAVTITGAGSALTLSGAATAIIGAASANTGALNVQNGGVFHSGTGLATVNATGTIAISGGTYNANGNLTLNGGQLTRTTGAFNLAAGRTFTVQAGGDAIFTGSFANTTASTIVVTGGGSTLSTTSFLSLGSSTFSIAAGGAVSTGAAQINIATFNGNGTATVDGPGSSLSGGVLNIAQGGHAGSLTFSNGATGAFAGILVDSSAAVDTNGALSIQSGASVTGTSLVIAPNAAANVGNVTITGAGSALTLSDTAIIGAASASIATLTVENGGTFTTGTGLTTVNATGDLNINAGGTMIVRGDMVVRSSLDIANGGTVIIDASAMPGPEPVPLAGFDDAEFHVPNDADFGGWEINDGGNVALHPATIPEPGAAALLFAALAPLLAGRHRWTASGAAAARFKVSARRISAR